MQHATVQRGREERCCVKRICAVAPVSINHYKQLTSRLLYITVQVLVMVEELYHDLDCFRNDCSPQRLRHVGWQIPTELFWPFCLVLDLPGVGA